MRKTPYKEDFVSPSVRINRETKEKQRQPRLVSSPELESHEFPQIDPRYEVVELIGRGGMGCVYKAAERDTGNIFAIKVLRPDLSIDRTSLKRFEQEVEATIGLTHPNLVTTDRA